MHIGMTHGMLLVALLAAAAVGAPAAGAREVFVSLTGDDAHAGTREAPLRTVAKASAQAGPGDVVTLRAGTYEESLRPARDGAEGRPIVYQGHPGETVRIANVGTGADVGGRSWVTLRNLAFGNCTEHWIYGQDAHHITVEDCSFDAVENARIWSGIGIRRGSHLTVRRCRFGTWGSPSGSGIGDMIDGRPCDYTLVEDCDFRGAHAGHSLVAAHGRHIVLRNNYFHNLWQKGLDLGERMFRQEHVPGSFYLIEHNVFFDTRLNYPVASNGAVGLQLFSYDSIVRNNVFLSNERLGIGANCWGDPARGGDITTGISNNRFYNNTFWGNNEAGMVMAHSRPREKDVGGNVIANNLFANNGKSKNHVTAQGAQLLIDLGKFDRGVGDNRVLSNCFWQPEGRPNEIVTGKDGGHDPAWWNQTYPEQFSGNLAADPKLTNPEREDFSLAPDSPCRGAGANLTRAVGSGDDSVWLRVEDARWFSDGMTLAAADWVKAGAAAPVQVKSVDYRVNVLTLAEPRTWKHGDPVNLYRDSTGQLVLRGERPDIGAVR